MVIRFADKREADAAFAKVKAGEIVIDGRVIGADYIHPHFWPQDKTRRYY